MEQMIEQADTIAKWIQYVVVISFGVFFAWSTYKLKYGSSSSSASRDKDKVECRGERRGDEGDTFLRLVRQQTHDQVSEQLSDLKHMMQSGHAEIKHDVGEVRKDVKTLNDTMIRHDERITTLFNKVDAAEESIRAIGFKSSLGFRKR